MTRLRHGKHLLRFGLSLILGLTFSSVPRAEDGPVAIPEGSGSIIRPVSWQLTGENAAALTEQVRAVVQQFEGAILVKDEKEIIVLSLPSAQLTDLQHQLSALGTLTSPEATEANPAPTTLLRLRLSAVSE